MRKKVNIKVPSFDTDYGKKPYASPTAYQGQVRKATSKLEHDNVVRQYSEFKRPQAGWDSYQDMEQWANNPPGIVIPDFPTPDVPGSEFPIPDFEWPESYICFCGIDKCYCPGQINCFDPGCTYPIVGASINSMTGGFSITIQKNRICIDAPSDAKGPIEVTLELLKLKPNGKGGVDSAGTCVVGKIYDQCQESKCCTGSIAWDTDLSAETITRNGSCTVAITDSGDNSPYTWSVSGTGFWFDSEYSVKSIQTSGLSVTLYADSEACGTATILVAACNGGIKVTGYVRVTIGSWGDPIQSCGSTGGGQYGELIEGKIKRVEYVCTVCPDLYCSTNPCGCDPDPPYFCSCSCQCCIAGCGPPQTDFEDNPYCPGSTVGCAVLGYLIYEWGCA